MNKTVIKFSATWCEPCKKLKPVFDKVVSKMNNVKAIEIDVESEPNITSSYKLRSVPTILVTDDNDEVLAMKTGFMTEEQLTKFIEES